MIKNFILKNKENIKRDLAKIVKYNSVYSQDEKPFGKENRLVLDETLKMMQEYGLSTKNLDYYCGYGEVGKGDKIVGILAHLDIVPSGDGWLSDPFELTEVDNKVYGRGVSDDKGAVIASLYAIKYLIEKGYDFKKRVRLIVGCNEETGSKCIKHYVEEEGHIDLGFTPDANFPGIYGEKGMLGGKIKAKSNIIDISGGTVSNVVCKYVKAKVLSDKFDHQLFDAYFKKNNIDYKIKESNGVSEIEVFGKAAHASLPDLGINAINHFFKALYEAKYDDEFIKDFNEIIGLNYHGELIGGLELNDDYSDLTMNLGTINKQGDEIIISLDARHPVTRNEKEVREVFNHLNTNSMSLSDISYVSPLFFDLDNPMIKALKSAYEEVTGDYDSKMEVIGGGTYAKAINNCIAFGCEFNHEDNHIHDANEVLELDSLYKQIEIYAKAIENLCEVSYE